MAAEELLREGKTDEALVELQKQVRANPADPKARTFLFQLLAVLGQWDRALTQLNVAGEMDPAALPMVQAYRELLSCEVLRHEVFSGKRAPLVFGDPEPWIALLVQSCALVGEGRYEEAAGLRDTAYEQAPASSGTVNGTAIEWIADADSRLGPVLEMVVNGRYWWVPFHRIARITFEEPADLRDMVWMPGHFTWSNGGDTVGFVPTRYAASHTNEDPLVVLARKTLWQEQAGDTYLGLGQRLFATDAGEYSLLDLREVVLDTGVADDSDADASSDT